MQLKNKTEREEFLENYREWELWKEIPEIEVKLYRYTFENGSVIIATEYPRIKFDFESSGINYIKGTGVNYRLILSNKDTYKSKDSIGRNQFYCPNGDRKSDLLDYLTVTKPEV